MKVCMGNPKNCESTKVCITQPCFDKMTKYKKRKNAKKSKPQRAKRYKHE